MTGTSLPPGFRFHPTDVELIMYYLKRKVTGKSFRCEAISEINIYKFSPWDLPDKSCLKSKDLEWYFFCPRERKYASGARMNRATETGYWKTTGKDRPVLYKEKSVGMIKTLIFHRGHAPHGDRTDWVMHEYKIRDEQLADAGIPQDAYVLCKLFHKNGRGPKNGAQYGAPFKEEEWDDDEMDCFDTFPLAAAPATLRLHKEPSSSAMTSMGGPESRSICLAEPGPSSVAPPVNAVLPNVPDDDISKMLALFVEDDALPPDPVNNSEKFANSNHETNARTIPCSDGNDIYNGLGDLGSWNMLGGSGFSLPPIQESDYMLMALDGSYLELNDLDTPLISSAEVNESMHVTASNLDANYNSFGVSEQLYFGVDHYGGNQYSSGLTQLPSRADGSINVEDVSNVLQVNNGDLTNANQGYNAAYNLAFVQSNENTEINQNNDWWIP